MRIALETSAPRKLQSRKSHAMLRRLKYTEVPVSSLCRSANQSFTINLSKLMLLLCTAIRNLDIDCYRTLSYSLRKGNKTDKAWYCPKATTKVNEPNLDLVTAAWSEDTNEICYSEKCPADISGVRTRVGALRNRDERCVSPHAYRTMIRVSLGAELKKKAIDTLR